MECSELTKSRVDLPKTFLAVSVNFDHGSDAGKSEEEMAGADKGMN